MCDTSFLMGFSYIPSSPRQTVIFAGNYQPLLIRSDTVFLDAPQHQVFRPDLLYAAYRSAAITVGFIYLNSLKGDQILNRRSRAALDQRAMRTKYHRRAVPRLDEGRSRMNVRGFPIFSCKEIFCTTAGNSYRCHIQTDVQAQSTDAFPLLS